MKKKCTVAAFHDGEQGRQAAVTFLDEFVERFWSEFDIEPLWWPLSLMEEPRQCTVAAADAVRADLIIFAIESGRPIPEHIKNWIEHWANQRGDREGALVGLSACEFAPDSLPEFQIYLRGVAHRAGLDYLTAVPESITHPIPESVESCAERAQQVTSVLDEILHCPAPPPRSFN